MTDTISDAPVGQNAKFGSEVAIKGSTVVVGASGEDLGTQTTAGAVYVYQLQADNTLLFKQKIADSSYDSNFGFSIALTSESLFYVGSRRSKSTLAFQHDGNTWALNDFLTIDHAGEVGQDLSSKNGWVIVSGLNTSQAWRTDEAGSYYATGRGIPGVWHSNSGASLSRSAISSSILLHGNPFVNSGSLDGIGSLYVWDVSRFVDRSLLQSPVNEATALDLDQTLTWSSDVDAAEHQLQVSTVSNFNSPEFDVSGISGPSHQLIGLASAQRYFWRVRSSNSDWSGVWSPTSSFTTEYQVPPIVANDDASLIEDTAVDVLVLDNDTDPDGDVLTIVSVSTPQNGTATIADGKIVYQPNANFYGQDTFTYSVQDEYTHVVSGTVSITVNPSPDKPVAVDDTCTVNEDQTGTCSILANDYDVDNDALTGLIIDGPFHGTASISASDLSYTGQLNYTGIDSLQYLISDGTGRADTAKVQITITPVNDLPVVQNEVAQMLEDVPSQVSVLANDSDPDGDALSLWAASGPEGWAVLLPGSPGSGVITLIPPLNFFGNAVIMYQVSDGVSHENDGQVEITVLPINDPPGAPAFESPESGSIVVIGGAPTDSLRFGWSAATDPDNDNLAYLFELGINTDLSSPLISESILDLSVSKTIDSFASLFLSQGLAEPGDRKEVFFRLSVSDDSVTTVGPTQAVTFERGLVTNSEGADVPITNELLPAYPNPSSSVVSIPLRLAQRQPVLIKIYNLLGQQIISDDMGMMSPGDHRYVLDDSTLPPGAYWARWNVSSGSIPFVLIR
ncbi:MAG: tandem-95 repeat protein [Bacteroidetes Order II. Incertae sedis bacterium]|nr:tandem-95 repeat protein [Bacteroidetes Order II. bacterium]